MPPAEAASATLGGINVEPSARPWRYVGANPDSWWCPVGQCTTSNPLGRIDTEMALAHQLNVANVRLEIPWFLVEPGRNGYDWSRADYIFSSASAHGVRIQPILVYTPTWDGGYNAFPPAADFGAFTSAFMARYGGKISAVEMWNEPDGGQSLVSNNPATYVQDILKPGYTAVKQSAYPGVQVIEGGSINDSGTCCAWLSGILSAGGGGYFDIAAFHDYGGNYAQIAAQYRGLVGNKPIWLGEYGVSDATGSQQTSLINGALANTPALAMAQFYTLRDESVYTCCPPSATGERKQYGVVASDDVTKKSSFFTMQSLLGGSSPPAPPKPSPHPASPTPSHPTPSHPTASPKATPTPSVLPSQTPSPSGGAQIPSSLHTSPLPSASQLLGAVEKGNRQVLYFGALLVGALGFVLGLALAMTIGALATWSPPMGLAILTRSPVAGFWIATGGAAVCLLAILLLIQLSRSG